MLEQLARVSDGEDLPYESAINSNSSQNSMSSDSCSSFSRLSFDAATDLPTSRSSPESLDLKPHRSSDFAYSAIRRRKSKLTFRDFRLLRRIGAGDIGTVYLCQLRNSTEGCYEDEDDDSCLYAMKVVDKDALELKKKVHRAEMERKILKMLDHPFLPTLYAEFEASHFSCIVMEFCSGGDLHSLRHKQPRKRFSLASARYRNRASLKLCFILLIHFHHHWKHTEILRRFLESCNSSGTIEIKILMFIYIFI